jgi:hypothetical protein
MEGGGPVRSIASAVSGTRKARHFQEATEVIPTLDQQRGDVIGARVQEDLRALVRQRRRSPSHRHSQLGQCPAKSPHQIPCFRRRAGWKIREAPAPLGPRLLVPRTGRARQAPEKEAELTSDNMRSTNEVTRIGPRLLPSESDEDRLNQSAHVF